MDQLCMTSQVSNKQGNEIFLQTGFPRLQKNVKTEYIEYIEYTEYIEHIKLHIFYFKMNTVF